VDRGQHSLETITLLLALKVVLLGCEYALKQDFLSGVIFSEEKLKTCSLYTSG